MFLCWLCVGAVTNSACGIMVANYNTHEQWNEEAGASAHNKYRA